MNKPPIKQKPKLLKKSNFDLKDKLSSTSNESIDRNHPDDSNKLTESKHHFKTNELDVDKSSIESTDKFDLRTKFNKLKLDESSTESLHSFASQERKINESTISQKVLDKNQLNKAFQLLNRSNFTDKDDEIVYDIRVDEEQIETCNQIIKILLESGYFRANIIGLSEFDKVSHQMSFIQLN